MALTVSLTGDWRESLGNKTAVVGTITFDTEYPTGGEELTLSKIGLSVVDFIEFNQGQGGYIFNYVYATNKIIVYVGDNDAGADGVLAQVANATDLATLTVKFRAIGR